MKVGFISQPNSKGQIVIPKKVREAVGITTETPLSIVARGGGVYIYPIKEIITTSNGTNEAYLEILKMTQGAWRRDTWLQTQKRRKKIELAESQKRKKAW